MAEHNDKMGPIYAKIFGNETVQAVDDFSEISVPSSDFCVTIKSAGGSVTIKIMEDSSKDDSLPGTES